MISLLALIRCWLETPAAHAAARPDTANAAWVESYASAVTKKN
jgi:hypothetical protein